MFPILFKIPGVDFPVKAFGLMVVIGFLLGTHVLDRLVLRYASNAQEKRAQYAAIPIWVLIGILAGARLMYVIVEVLQGTGVGQSFLDQPWKVFAYWEGGLVMYGGTAGAIAAGVWCFRRHGLPLGNSFDLVVVACFSGLFIGRIGCFIVGDDYGSVVPASFVEAPFPLVLQVPDPLPEGSLFGDENAGQVLWATQIWMSLNALALAVLGARHLRRRRWAGQTGFTLLFLYSIARGIIESFRGDAVRGLWWNGSVSTSQVISIFLGAFCLVILWTRRHHDQRPMPGAQVAA